MRGLGQVVIRCRDHDSHDPQCEICRFIVRAERDLAFLRARRDRVFREIKDRLAKHELIMIDLR
jgi:hypothetical protein